MRFLLPLITTSILLLFLQWPLGGMPTTHAEGALSSPESAEPLEISKTAPAVVLVGEPITYTLTITNNHTDTMTNINVMDMLPEGANYVDGGLFNGHIVTWTIPALAPTSSVNVQFVVTATETITNSDYFVIADGGYDAVGEEAVVTNVSRGAVCEEDETLIPTCFMDRQVLVTGVLTDVTTLENEFISYTNVSLGKAGMFTFTENNEMATYLYDIEEGMSVSDTVELMNQTAITLGLSVHSEPNYLIAVSGLVHIHGSPAAVPHSNIFPTLLHNQWIWDSIDLSARGGLTGQETRVVVFDTSPFSYAVNENPYSEYFHDYPLHPPHPYPHPHHPLQVWHLAELEPLSSDHAVAGHGYSAVDLVHQVAPDAELHMVRVLNENGIGDLFTLNYAINELTQEFSDDPYPTIFNSSLGVLANPLKVPEIRSLEAVVRQADEAGFLQIAAAGNWSTIGHIAPTQYPAVFDTVLAVAAHNVDGRQSCFASKTFDGVTAPGGDMPDDCKLPPNCESDPNLCVIALDLTSGTGVSGWVGSSFSTPLVAGIAALTWQEGIWTYGDVMSQEVTCAIKLGAQETSNSHLGWGRAQVGGSLHALPDVMNGASCSITELSLSPSMKAVGVGETFEWPIIVQSSDQLLDGASAYLNFDPNVLQVEKIIEGSTFPTILTNTFDNDLGQIDFAAGSFDDYPSGTFTLATVRFTALEETETEVTFNLDLPRQSNATFDGESVLDGVEDGILTIRETTVVASVTLQGRPAPPDPRWSVPLDVSFTIPGEATPAYVFTPTTDEMGHFILTGITPGTYEVRVKHSHTLQNKVTVTLVGGEQEIDLGTLLEGDANDDNFVHMVDFSILASTFGRCEGNTGYDPRADFNGDDCVDILDFSLLASNFGEGGDMAPFHQPDVRKPMTPSTSEVSLIVEPAILDSMTAGERVVVTVRAESNIPIDGVAIALGFDPSLLRVRSSTGASGLPLVLNDRIDQENGTLHFAAGSLSEQPLGNVELLEIEFEALAEVASVPLNFLFASPHASEVTSGGQSVLTSHQDGSTPPEAPTAVTLTKMESATRLGRGQQLAFLLGGGLLLLTLLGQKWRIFKRFR